MLGTIVGAVLAYAAIDAAMAGQLPQFLIQGGVALMMLFAAYSISQNP